jgi:hypothetical protein
MGDFPLRRVGISLMDTVILPLVLSARTWRFVPDSIFIPDSRYLNGLLA